MEGMEDMPTGIPWLDKPVLLHSSREDNCTMTPEQCAYRSGHWRYWYIADLVYALGTVYFMCAVIGVFAIEHFLSRYMHRSISQSALVRTPRALVRYLSYRVMHLPSLSWNSPGLGVALLIVIGTVFFSAMTLGPKPYYWPNTKTISYGNSPPIATRTGWIALALLPFVLALASKANMISALTGISHERLQVYHHWASYAMFVLALIHTFPFIVHHIWKGDMMMEWDTSMVYWTGVVALIFQAYLTFMSLPSIRNRYYEFFKVTHVASALIFVLFFFFHCDFRMTSWDYFIATGAIYFASLLYSQCKTYFVHGLHTAIIEQVPGGLVRITIPTRTSWKPGQHVFIRFLTLGINSFTAHPFTISSVPQDVEKDGEPSQMKFCIQPRGGITARLAKLAQAQPSPVRVLIEGPYGGLGFSSLGKFDVSIVASGGSGAGFSLGVIEDALRRYCRSKTGSDSQPGQFRPRLHIIYATRQSAVAEWYAGAVKYLVTCYRSQVQVSASIHLTAENMPSPRSELDCPGDIEKDLTKDSVLNVASEYNDVINHERGRPDLPSIISNMAGSDDGKMRSIGITVCGPASMIHDVSNASARAQGNVLAGKTSEVSLHAEHFSW